jgi:hypothetical protein
MPRKSFYSSLLLLPLLSGCVVNVLNGRDPQKLVTHQVLELNVAPGKTAPSSAYYPTAYYPLGLVHPRYPDEQTQARMPYAYYPYYPVEQNYSPDYGSGYAVYPSNYGTYPCPQGFQAFPYYPGNYQEYPYYPQGYWCSPKVSRDDAYYPAPAAYGDSLYYP